MANEEYQDPRGVPNMCKTWSHPKFQTSPFGIIRNMYDQANDTIPSGFRDAQRFLKSKFGRKHDHFYKYNEINLGWSNPENTWRASISNRGFAFYVSKEFNEQQTEDAFGEFLKVIS